MQFSKQEIIALLKAWVFVSLVFGVAARGSMPLIELMLTSAIAVGIGFLLHELAHKYVAQRYGLQAEFVSFDTMLLVSLLLSLAHLIFLAPGAVMIKGADSIRMGRIAAAGPLVNIVLAVGFLLAWLIAPFAWIAFAAYINAFLALFNMLPLFVLDGKKVLKWNKTAFWSLLITSGALVIITALVQ